MHDIDASADAIGDIALFVKGSLFGPRREYALRDLRRRARRAAPDLEPYDLLDEVVGQALEILCRSARFSPGPGAALYLMKVLQTAARKVRRDNELPDRLLPRTNASGDLMKAPRSLEDPLNPDQPGVSLRDSLVDEHDPLPSVVAEYLVLTMISFVPPRTKRALYALAFEDARIGEAAKLAGISRFALHRDLDALSRTRLVRDALLAA